MALVVLAGCGSASAPSPTGVAPRGTGPDYELGSLSAWTARALPVGELRCRPGRRVTHWAHVELFARGRVLLLPAGIGIAPPRSRDGAYVSGGRCRYPVWTDEPTGLVAVSGVARVGDLAAVWGRPLGPARLAGFRGPVRAWLDGRAWRGDPRDIPLRRHAQVVLQAGAPTVAPHARYRFPAGR
jgi:hypothetical protein